MRTSRTCDTCAAIAWLALGALMATSGCRKEVMGAPHAPASSASIAKPLDFRTLVYSANFAANFKLPPGGVERLDPGLQAVALRVSESAVTGALCGVDLYLDDTVDFAYPRGNEGRASDIRTVEQPGPLSLFYQLVDDDLRSRLASRWQEPKALFRLRTAGGTVKEFQTLPAESFYRAPVEGLNIVTFELICTVLRVEPDVVEVWLLRPEHSVEEIKPTAPKIAAAHRFDIPARLLHHAREAITKAAQAQADPTRVKIYQGTSAGAYSLPN